MLFRELILSCLRNRQGFPKLRIISKTKMLLYTEIQRAGNEPLADLVSVPGPMLPTFPQPYMNFFLSCLLAFTEEADGGQET